jgi:hypothetical protein
VFGVVGDLSGRDHDQGQGQGQGPRQPAGSETEGRDRVRVRNGVCGLNDGADITSPSW